MTSEPIGGEFAIFWSVTTDEPLTESEVLTRASLPALGSRHDDYHDFELVKITPESTADPLEWKVHLTYRKATMYEKLIEALREEANIITERFRSPIGGTDAKLIDIADALANVAHRLEGEESPFDLSTVTLHPASERITNPTEPPSIPSLSPDDRLDIRCRASRTTSAPPNDDDEPLTAEWLESAQPAILAADDDCVIALCRMPAYGRVAMTISGSAATLEYVTTRGDYRTLRRMLGVPMEESPTTRVWVDDHCYPERAGWREFPTDQLPEIPPGGWLCAASRPDQPDAFDVMNPSGECESMGWVPVGEDE